MNAEANERKYGTCLLQKDFSDVEKKIEIKVKLSVPQKLRRCSNFGKRVNFLFSFPYICRFECFISAYWDEQ